MFSKFLLIVSIVGRVLPIQYQDYDDHWGYSLGDDWDVSDDIAATNPYYNTWQQLSAQMDHHAFAQHMGQINRGQLANPEYNLPGQRAFGHDSDFNKGDFAYESGAFQYKSKGQNVVATQAYVDLGLATKVGEHVIVPPGVQVLPDGSITIQSSHPWSGHQQHNPCNPNPCSKYLHHLECVAVNAHTAKCSPCGDYQLVLSWTGASGKTAKYDLLLVPEKKKGGTLCDILLEENKKYIGSTNTDGSPNIDDDCGTEPGDADSVSGTEFDDGDTTASTTHTLTTSAVSLDIPPITSAYHDYIYQIILHQDPIFKAQGDHDVLDLDEASPVLTVKYKGVKVADIAVPQGGANNKNAYFFGCFVPQSNTCGHGYINQGGSDFYDTFIAGATRTDMGSTVNVPDDSVTGGGGLFLGNAGLCSATRILE